MTSQNNSDKILLWLVAAGFFMETLDGTIVNTALPSMAKALNESPLYMQSVIIAYALTLAVLIPVSGWLTDRFGIRRVYIGAITIFTIGSVFCAISQTLPQLVLSRVIQGMGGSMLMPVGRLAILRNFPGTKYLPAISFVAIPALIGPLVGPTLGGWLVEFASWHWIFLINLPIGLVLAIMTQKAMPQDEFEHNRSFDLVGFFQISAFMISVSFALDGMSGLNFSYGLVLLLFVFGLAALAGYVLHAQKVKSPLISPGLFKERTYSIGILGNMFARLGSSGMPFMVPLFFQLCLGYSPLQAGLSMIPLSASAIVAKRFVAPMVGRFGYRKFLMSNTIISGLTIGTFALINPGGPKWFQILHLFFFGIFNSMQFTAMNTLTLKDLDRKMASDGNALFSMVQMLAMSFSVAAAGSLLTTFLHHYNKLDAFHGAFLSLGALTCTSAWIFAQLNKDSSP
jgi:EmrB/QacA subfamily drug resistance transporter